MVALYLEHLKPDSRTSSRRCRTASTCSPGRGCCARCSRAGAP